MPPTPAPAPLLRLRIRRRFCAGATLHRPDWSEERNRSTYGVCANPRGHGHDYRLTVEVEGPLDAETGLVMDYAALQRLVDERVVGAVDHRHLNHDVDFLRGVNPTAENVARAGDGCTHPGGGLRGAGVRAARRREREARVAHP